MLEKKSVRMVLKWINNYVTFFLMVAFVITCCMMLFVKTLSSSLGITLTGENLNSAAKLTFGNVVLLSLIFSVIDSIRRKFTIDIPVKCITDAAEKNHAGRF